MCMLQDDGTFSCKHGPTECAGNLQQLCVQLHSKSYQRYDWLYKFVLCENKQGLDAIGTFTTAASCLKVGAQLRAGAAASIHKLYRRTECAFASSCASDCQFWLRSAGRCLLL